MEKISKNKECTFTTMVLNKIKTEEGIKKSIELAEYLDIKPNTLSIWIHRNSIQIDKIISKCSDFDFNWLFRTDSQYSRYLMKKGITPSEHKKKSENNPVEDENNTVNSYKDRIKELENQVNTLILQNSTLTRILENVTQQK